MKACLNLSKMNYWRTSASTATKRIPKPCGQHCWPSADITSASAIRSYFSILFLQEHWRSDDQLQGLGNLDSIFLYLGLETQTFFSACICSAILLIVIL